MTDTVKPKSFFKAWISEPLPWVGVVFIAGKVIGNISWPWLWVLAPFWVPFVLAIVLVVILAIAKACAK